MLANFGGHPGTALTRHGSATEPESREEKPMLQIHVALSLIGMVSGFVVLYGLLTGRSLNAWTAIFLVTTIFTSVTGFPLEPFGFDRHAPSA